MERKVYKGHLTLKADGQPGEFRAVFATLNVKDHDGDVTLPGAFTEGEPAIISHWNHGWEELPVGKGVVHADDNEAWIDGAFFLTTQTGKEHYETVKSLGELQEWSYGFEILDAEDGKLEGEPVRFLKRLRVIEVSPVMQGAGIDTRTAAIKSATAKTAADFATTQAREKTIEELSREQWRISDAWHSSMYSILSDETMDTAAKLELLQTSGTQYVAAMVEWARRALAAGYGQKALRAEGTKEGRRNSTADLSRLQKMHDILVEMGVKCGERGEGKEPEGETEKNRKPSGPPSTFAAKVAIEMLEMGY